MGRRIGWLRASILSAFLLVIGSPEQRIEEKTEERKLLSIRFVGSTGLILNECEGDCDLDSDCSEGLICFQRKPFQEVPGCTGGGIEESTFDVCIDDPNAAPVQSPEPIHRPTLRPTSSPIARPTPEPTLYPTPSPTKDATGRPTNAPSFGATASPSSTPSLRPTTKPNPVPISRQTDPPSPVPTPRLSNPPSPPSPQPPNEPTRDTVVATYPTDWTSLLISQQPTISPLGTVEFVGNGHIFYSNYPLGTNEEEWCTCLDHCPFLSLNLWQNMTDEEVCKGDCDSNEDCAEGLICHQRNANESVPYCLNGELDPTTTDYCIWDGLSSLPQPPQTQPNGTFRLKLYWEQGYRWQGETFEREWCMDYNYNGYPGIGVCWVGPNNVTCNQSQVYIAKCIDDPKQWFKFVDLGNSTGVDEVLIQTGDGQRCFERQDRDIWLRGCDPSNSLQRWYAPNGDFYGRRFEITQASFSSWCVTNEHHPKSGEVIKLYDCEFSRSKDSQTSYWNKF